MAKPKETAQDTELPKKQSDVATYQEVFEEQRENLIRHLQQFLKSPLFINLRESPVDVSDSQEAIDERKRDLDYRIKVLTSLLTLLTEEREGLERARPADSGSEADDDMPDTSGD